MVFSTADSFKAEAKAAEATKTSGCPCRLRGWVGQEEGEEITTETKLSYEWCAIRTVAGQPYTVQIRYRDLITQGRPVPNCPIRLGHLRCSAGALQRVGASAGKTS